MWGIVIAVDISRKIGDNDGRKKLGRVLVWVWELRYGWN